MKNKIYMVVSNGKMRDTDKVYSKAYGLFESREGYQYLNAKDVLYLDEIKEVGHKFEVVLTIK